MRLRQSTFATLLSLDIGFFDAPENQVGSLLTSLEWRETCRFRGCFLTFFYCFSMAFGSFMPFPKLFDGFF